MFKLKIYCNDRDVQYWEDGIGEYETYDKALLACYRNSLCEVKELTDCGQYFEVEQDFEITEAYVNEELKDISFFPVATVFYDRAPQDRENDCDIEIVTGYYIVEI